MFPIILLGGLAYLIYSSATNLSDKISFAPVGISLRDGILKLKITNPTDTTAKIERVNGFIYANKSKVGTYDVDKSFTIPAKNSIILNVKFKLNGLNIYTELANLLIAKKTPKIAISGKIKTSITSIDFENTLVDNVVLNYAKF